MDKEQVANIGFEIVAYSGDARTKLLLALKDAKAGKFDEVDALVEEAKGLLNDASTPRTTSCPRCSWQTSSTRFWTSIAPASTALGRTCAACPPPTHRHRKGLSWNA